MDRANPEDNQKKDGGIVRQGGQSQDRGTCWNPLSPEGGQAAGAAARLLNRRAFLIIFGICSLGGADALKQILKLL